MKKIILLIVVTILAANVATAQQSKTIKKETQAQRVEVGTAQQQVVTDRNADVNKRLSKAQNEVRNAQNAVNAAQRELVGLVAKQQKQTEKFARKLAKITNKAKREDEQMKFDQKMVKEQIKVQEAYDRALARLYRAQEDLERAQFEEGLD